MPKPAGPVARKSDYEVVAIPFAPKVKTARAQEARKLLREQHYACGGPNTAVLMAGLVRKDTDELVGVAQFLPTSPPAARYTARRCSNTSPKQVLALSRLVVDRDEPQNAATILIGAALRRLKKDRRWSAVVSYADEAEGHVGTVYKASNWLECGKSAPRERWVNDAGCQVGRKATRDRTVRELEALGFRRGGKSSKRRFLYALRGACSCDVTR